MLQHMIIYLEFSNLLCGVNDACTISAGIFRNYFKNVSTM